MMIVKTYTYCTFFFNDTSFEYIKKLNNDLDSFTETETDVNFEEYLKKLLAEKQRLNKAGVSRIAIYHTLIYDYQCNTEFSPAVIELIKDIGATLCLSTDIESGNPQKIELYQMLETIRKRPGMYLGTKSITRLESFMNGFCFNHEMIDYGTPSFDKFNDFIGDYYGKFTTAGWRNLILSAHFGNEEEAIDAFYVLLDEFKQDYARPNTKAIIFRLLHLAMLDFRAEDDHQRQSQVANMLHNVSNQLLNAVYMGHKDAYDAILQSIFERAIGNQYLYHYIKTNIQTSTYFEYELWADATKSVVLKTQDSVINKVESNLKLITKFFALNDEKAIEQQNLFYEIMDNKQKLDNTLQTHHLTFYTEYYQFYILDSETQSATDDVNFWNDEANTRRLAVVEGLIGVTVAKYAEIKVEVRVLNSEPKLDNDADHVVETLINLPSGILELKCCTNYETQLKLDLLKDNYKIRVSSYKLGSVQSDEGDDFYVVEIWKSQNNETKILKAFQIN